MRRTAPGTRQARQTAPGEGSRRRGAIGRHARQTAPRGPEEKKEKEKAKVRMGKGKGNPEYFVCRVKPGRIIFEIDGVNDILAKEAFDRAASKLPIKTKIIKRNVNI